MRGKIEKHKKEMKKKNVISHREYSNEKFLSLDEIVKNRRKKNGSLEKQIFTEKTVILCRQKMTREAGYIFIYIVSNLHITYSKLVLPFCVCVYVYVDTITVIITFLK